MTYLTEASRDVRVVYIENDDSSKSRVHVQSVPDETKLTTFCN